MNILKKFFSRNSVKIFIIVVSLVVVAVFSLCVGATYVPIKAVILSLVGIGKASANYNIVIYVRLPRTLAALCAGTGLAVAGAVLQSVLRNPLASCSVMGINAGSGLMSLVAVIVLPAAVYARPLFAFLGAIIATFAVFFLAKASGASRSTMALSGVAISAFLGAIIDTLITLFPEIGLDRITFTIGGFGGVNLTTTLVCMVFVLIGLILSLFLSYDLNVCALGELASSLGVNVRRVHLLAIVAISIMAGAAIAVGGLIGFVGLIVPHIARLLFGGDNRVIIPVSACLGSVMTLGCDIIARSCFSPYELPVGIILSLIGAPFFIFLLFRSKRHAR